MLQLMLAMAFGLALAARPERIADELQEDSFMFPCCKNAQGLICGLKGVTAIQCLPLNVLKVTAGSCSAAGHCTMPDVCLTPVDSPAGPIPVPIPYPSLMPACPR
mmetsp:Transcript_119405/g.283472  ORF Transcript_119405/g.283472 Transcript_119405/m.283472 type:complete len:105 (+) Transcript_119405:79-393(+)